MVVIIFHVQAPENKVTSFGLACIEKWRHESLCRSLRNALKLDEDMVTYQDMHADHCHSNTK